MMHDLRKVEEKFHEYLKSRLNEESFRIDEIKITEDLLEQEEAFYIWFGSLSYFLVIEDGKPVVYANACSRMDLDVIALIDETGYEEYDLWDGNHPDASERYRVHARNVKKFNDEDLKFLSDVEK